MSEIKNMPYCPECGKKVSITDKRCSKCGTKLSKELFEDIPKANEFVSNLNDNTQKLKDRKYHNIEFALAIITVVLTVISLSHSLNGYYVSESLVPLILLLILLAVIAAIITRYYAKLGAVILLIIGFLLILFGALYTIIPIIFYIITAVVAFVLN